MADETQKTPKSQTMPDSKPKGDPADAPDPKGDENLSPSCVIDPKLLEILVCPVTKGPLRYDREASELICDQPDWLTPFATVSRLCLLMKPDNLMTRTHLKNTLKNNRQRHRVYRLMRRLIK